MNLLASIKPDELAIFSFAVGLLGMIFWMVVGWRAMRAHERLAQSHEQICRIASVLGAKYGQPDEGERRFQRGPIPPSRGDKSEG